MNINAITSNQTANYINITNSNNDQNIFANHSNLNQSLNEQSFQSNSSINNNNDQDQDENDFNDHLLNASASSYSPKYVTCCEYYSNKLMRFEDSTHHYFGRLYQQYIVDQYLKIENSKLQYIRHNQAKLRVEMYKGLVDAYAKGDGSLEDTGQMIILPSSFNGGPRYMLNLFQDAMAIVKEFGKPDLFVTITCNPHWQEITNELGPNQTAQDIPDIVSTVFKLKLKALMDLIMKKHVLGKNNKISQKQPKTLIVLYQRKFQILSHSLNYLKQ
jgi:hypothetical protein